MDFIFIIMNASKTSSLGQKNDDFFSSVSFILLIKRFLLSNFPPLKVVLLHFLCFFNYISLSYLYLFLPSYTNPQLLINWKQLLKKSQKQWDVIQPYKWSVRIPWGSQSFGSGLWLTGSGSDEKPDPDPEKILVDFSDTLFMTLVNRK